VKETLSAAFKAHHLVVELEYDLVGDPIVEGEVVSDLGVVRAVGHRALEGGGLRQLTVYLNPEVLINEVFVEVKILLEDRELLAEPALWHPTLRGTFHCWQ
jgi:hypothetical protein